MTYHPMLPTNEQIRNWESAYFDHDENLDVLLIQVYQEGADAELEACCEHFGEDYFVQDRLRTARRPKPPSLAEQGMESLSKVMEPLKILLPNGNIWGVHIENIQKCLERLKELEENSK